MVVVYYMIYLPSKSRMAQVPIKQPNLVKSMLYVAASNSVPGVQVCVPSAAMLYNNQTSR